MGVGWDKEIADRGEGGNELLKPKPRSEALHHALALANRNVRILGPIVQPFMRAVLDIGHDGFAGCGIGSKLVGDNALGRVALFSPKPRQQVFGGLCVPVDLDYFIKSVTVLIDGTPKIASLALDRDDNLVEVPDVVPSRRLSLQSFDIVRSELHRPAPDRLVGNDDAALQQHLLDEAQAEGKPKIQPDSVGDDFGGKAVALVTHGRRRHSPALPPQDLRPG
jgi:hypothetical protein